MTVPSFQVIHEAALMRHGSEELRARLPKPRSDAELRAMPADRYLSLMSQRIFRAGLRYSVVDAKWPAFEEVFFGFDVDKVAGLYDEQMEALLEDKRIIRHMGKLMAVRHNAQTMRDIGDFAGWIAEWPVSDIVGLWGDLAKQMKQLGGNSGAMFLRMVGKDTFVLSDGVVRGLGYWQAFDGIPKSKRDKVEVQRIFNRWAEESGLPLCQLSMTLAMSTD